MVIYLFSIFILYTIILRYYTIYYTFYNAIDSTYSIALITIRIEYPELFISRITTYIKQFYQ